MRGSCTMEIEKMESNIGWSEIVGVVIGVSKDYLELLEESIISK